MSSTSAPVSPPNPANVQGLLYRAFSHPFSAHLLFQLDDRSKPGSFVKALLPKVQSAADWGGNKPSSLLNIGITYTGLKAINLPFVNAGYFPIEFRMGPTNYYSQQSLYDLGPSAPGNWRFGGNNKTRVDIVVHAYALTEGDLQTLIGEITAAANASQVREFFPMATEPRRYLGNPTLGNKIQFGYRDGIDQPSLHWPSPWPTTQKENTDNQAANNFLLGYPNSALIPGPQNTPDNNATGEFCKDGFYNAFRVFFQDVHLFEQFLERNAPLVMQRIAGLDASAAKEWLAGKMNGRWRDGSPLELTPDTPNPDLASETAFGYSQDTQGLRCPFSAHTRVANPRDEAIFAQTEDPLPRIVRRGIPYGPVPAAPDYKGEQGLIGIFLCGSISQQFEKIFGWMNGNNMSPLFKFLSQDVLLGNRNVPQVVHRFEIPMTDGDPLVLDLAGYQFVVTRGSAYTLMPSIAALQQISER